MTQQPDPGSYEPFIAEAVRQLQDDGAEPEVIEAANFAMQKAQLLWTGEPLRTIRLDPSTGATAMRTPHPETGIPLWRVTNPDGTQHDDHRPSLPSWTWIAGPTTPESN